MAIRGDRPLQIKQRAGHSAFATTEIYIREAEAIQASFGTVFPPLPPNLLALGKPAVWADAKISVNPGIASENWRGGRDSNPTIAALNSENYVTNFSGRANDGRTVSPARAFLEALATGDLVGDALHERARYLAEEVLAEPRVALARQVIERGPHWVRASVELADTLLASEAAHEGGKEVAS